MLEMASGTIGKGDLGPFSVVAREPRLASKNVIKNLLALAAVLSLAATS